jgi:protein-L-isoaspartate(D-aspartate) O-methyltransferase
VSEYASLGRRLMDELAASGDLTPQWRSAFDAVPRHLFIPDLVWREERMLVPLRRSDDPATWLELAYANSPVITQVDDGHPVGPGLIGSEISSSASKPAVVARMLAALRAEPGMSVLEIGTGSGYQAALLAHRLGGRNVTSIEIDAAIVARACKVLSDAAYGTVTVVTGDGAAGFLPHAPYDRVIATVGACDVPPAWVAQTKPGGRIVLPWATEYHNGGLLALTVANDGTASGGIVGNVAFMLLRDQRSPYTSLREMTCDEDRALITSTDVHPYHVAGDYDTSFAIGVRVPRCRNVYRRPATGEEFQLYFVDAWSRSWACLHHRPNATEYQVRQFGPRRLWTEVESAYYWWIDAGRPPASQWTFTVTPAGQRIELT